MPQAPKGRNPMAGFLSTPSPNGVQADGQTSPPADSPASPQADKKPDPAPTKSYRLWPAHTRQFAAWAKLRGLTESEATRRAQVFYMDHYEEGQP
jgi:hypothetical protein